MIDATITVDSKEVVAGLDKLATTLQTTVIESAIVPVLKKIQADAQRQHRYKRRTGRLERSIKVTSNKSGGEVFIDDTFADYGKYVHDGFKGWAPDKFLDKAVDKNSRALDAAVDKAIDQAINKAGF